MNSAVAFHEHSSAYFPSDPFPPQCGPWITWVRQPLHPIVTYRSETPTTGGGGGSRIVLYIANNRQCRLINLLSFRRIVASCAQLFLWHWRIYFALASSLYLEFLWSERILHIWRVEFLGIWLFYIHWSDYGHVKLLTTKIPNICTVINGILLVKHCSTLSSWSPTWGNVKT